LFLAGRPVGILNFATQEWQFLSAADLQLLSAAGAHVSGTLERLRLFEEVQAARNRLARELEMAREVQASLLPHPLPAIAGYELAADWKAAYEVAGDFYDVFSLARGWAFVVADVSDKGAPAALFMAMTRSLIRSNAGHSPAGALAQVNAALCAHSDVGMFVSAFFTALDPQDHALVYANAGHPPAILRRASGELALLAPTGPLLGVLEQAAVGEQVLRLDPGDQLVAYTDGVTEALNAADEEFGTERLMEAVAMGPAGASEMLEHLLKTLVKFTGHAPQADDVTFLVLERNSNRTE
jgi:sigma-B regulation protein RsbU (phosphoserine phosphatase)